jgi:hypothetical protein
MWGERRVVWRVVTLCNVESIRHIQHVSVKLLGNFPENLVWQSVNRVVLLKNALVPEILL